MTYASVAASADIDVYANWAEIMVRMTYGSVGADLSTVKDFEAAQYVGKNVEVRALVVAVYTSKKGNTLLTSAGSTRIRLSRATSRQARNWRATAGPSRSKAT